MFALFALFLLFFAGVASAVGDVAYIYRKQFRIDENIVKTFEDDGLVVDLINEKNLPSNFNGYDLVFVGDENFLNANRIPVNDKKAIIVNYYNAPTWGITDFEGISQLGASKPLSVVKDGRVVPAYTSAFFPNSYITISYYYLGQNNIAPSLQSIAKTEPTSSGGDFGDVIAYAEAGDRLLNGKTQRENLCFFGIVASDYWTPQARNLFNDCFGFVASECSEDSDCGNSSFVGQPFCQDGDVYRDKVIYDCSKNKVLNKCVDSEESVLIEDCQFGCENGACLAGTHDVGFVDFSTSIDKIKIETNNGTDVLGQSLLCNENYKISVTLKNFGDLPENVSFSGNVGNINFSHNSVNNIAPEETSLRTRTVNFSLFEGNYNLTVRANLLGDENVLNNLASRSLFVSCPIIECSSDTECNDNNQSTQDVCLNPGTPDSMCEHYPIACNRDLDCGTDGFIESPFCSLNNSKDVLRKFQKFSCLNPGTRNALCRSDIENRLVQTCSQICTNGNCGGIRCNNDLECNDNNPLTNDRCINPGTVISECRNTPINCASNLDCGSTGFIGNEYCSLNNVSKNFQTATCINPDTKESFCDIKIESRSLESCQFACSEGACVRCDSNLDCNDNNPNTRDLCNLPGTRDSYCSNDPIGGDVSCNSDAECGLSTPLSAPFCSVKDVNQLVLEWQCNNPGTVQSYCSSMVERKLVRTCSEFCSNGNCIDIRCVTNVDCNDNNSNTVDVCNNPGSENSFCTNNPIGIICDSNSDCGNDGFIGNNICYGNSVTRLFQSFTCYAPGTPFSFCSSSLSQKTIEQCSFTCSNGQCIGQENECVPGQTRSCGFSNVGECKLGTQTCGANGFYGACVGAVNPTGEVCDNKDNNCNGQSDEGLQCVPDKKQCDDDIDNDGDGFIDYPADPGCVSRLDDSELPVNSVPDKKQCDDDIDNDGDGFIDYPADPGCVSRLDDSELPVNSVPDKKQCDDDIDNDGDGFIDYPADPGCTSRNDDTETGRLSECDDDIDNDRDGFIDYPADPQCSSRLDNKES